MNRNRYVAAIFILALSSCASSPIAQRSASESQVSDRCVVTHDSFRKQTLVRTRNSMTGGLVLNALYRLEAVIPDDGKEADYYLWAETDRSLSGGALWNELIDQNGTKFPVVTLDWDVHPGSTVTESVRAVLNRPYLESVKSGITVRLYGKTTLDIPLRNQMISGFLARVDSLKH